MKETRDPRSDRMAELYRGGQTFAEIGQLFDLSWERVRQLVAHDHGLGRLDGGAHKKIQLRKERKLATRNVDCLSKYGCTFDDYRKIRGEAAHKFYSQKTAARKRGIGWGINLWQWWTVWQESGKWALRGRGQGYAMCRKGDVGPYAVGNVFIGLATDNSSEAHRKNSDLPVGVLKNRRYAGYSVTRKVHGVTYRLGSFQTPELAREAYLSVGRAAPSNEGRGR